MARNGNKKERIALLLAAGFSIRKAAGRCQVGARTVYRWLDDEGLSRRVHELRTQMFERAVGRLAHIAGKATSVLNRLLDSADDRVRLFAAKTILETGIKAREALELVERLDVLENRFDVDRQ